MNRRARIATRIGVGLCVAVVCVIIAASMVSDRLWFSSLGFASVYDHEFAAKSTLFLGFGTAFGALVAANIALGFGLRPMLVGGPEPTGITRYRAFFAPIHRRSLVLSGVVVGLIAGWVASSHWLTLLMWRNRQPFGVKDPYFHRDAGFYVFDLPWWHFVTEFAMSGLLISLVAATAVHYLYGGLRLQPVDRHLTRAAGAHLAGIGAAILLLRGVQIWLDRYDLVVSPGTTFSGMSYVGYHAVLPGQTLLAWLAVVCAVLLVAGAWRTQWLFSTVALCLYAVAIVGIGVLWPTILNSAKVVGHVATAESSFAARNIAATRVAYGLNGIVAVPGSATAPDVKTLTGNAQIAAIRSDSQLASPSLGLLSRAEVGYYVIDGQPTEVLLSVKRSAGKDELVGAFATPAGAAAAKSTEGWWTAAQLATYLGVAPESLSIDPARSGYQVVSATDAIKGYSLGSWWARAASAVRYADPDILGADSSQLVDLRQPLQRVQRLAPWLTLDSQIYPAVVDGHVVWVLDGYTTTAQYPESQVSSLAAITATSQNPRPTFGSATGDSVNYIRDSVKVIVDASTGAVTFYAWDEQDPILKAMRSAFPGLIQAKASIPASVQAVLRYPTTLFDVQRTMLASYHDTDPTTFLTGAHLWVTAPDPQEPDLAAPALRGLVENASGTLVPTLSATYVNPVGKVTDAYLSVNTDSSSSEFGQISMQAFPSSPAIDAPGAVAERFAADPRVIALKKKLKTLTEGQLVTVPLAGGVLQTETLYGSSVQPGRAQAFVATFGGAIGYGRTLEAAISDIGHPIVSKSPSATSAQLVREAEALLAKTDSEKGDPAKFQADVTRAKLLLKKALKDPALAPPSASPTAAPTKGATK